MNYPTIRVQASKSGHIQGIAFDKAGGFMYCSFTTVLMKIDMKGNVVGTVDGIVGHLGCIAFDENTRRVYGSLEYKNDIIGRHILKAQNSQVAFSDSFYIVYFDVDKIDRIAMNAENDGIMKAIYLKDVVTDYMQENHRYGCSGIDGVTFAPDVERQSNKNFLYVAYGIYSDNERCDNDYQVILKYDTEGWDRYATSLCQDDMHTFGPAGYDEKYFVYTGNTTYGIQNIEYDSYTNGIFAAVYKGKKPEFENYSLFMIDLNEKPRLEMLKGMNEQGKVLSLKKLGNYDEKNRIYGWNFQLGTTGMASLGDGFFYFSNDWRENDIFGTVISPYCWNGKTPFIPIENN